MRRIAGILCCVLFLQCLPLCVQAMTEQEWAEVKISELRHKMAQMSKEKIVEVHFKNKSKLRGYLVMIEKETFTICCRSGNIIIPYGEVQKIRSGGMSNNTKFFIGVGVAVGSMILLARILLPYT